MKVYLFFYFINPGLYRYFIVFEIWSKRSLPVLMKAHSVSLHCDLTKSCRVLINSTTGPDFQLTLSF